MLIVVPLLAFGFLFATGINQYQTGTASADGLCHGAFANTNGNFGIIGQDHISQASTGDNNADGCGLNSHS
jgi:hypothetical protein